MRKRILGAVLGVLMLTACLCPLAYRMETGRDAQQANDAAHLIEPMLRLMESSPQKKAEAPVGALMEIEDAWAIEDTREESWDPLVTGMRNGESELGYDRESRTFYCTVGMNAEGDWPQIELHAQGAEGSGNLQVAWIDDYTYDFRSDAVAMGYRYELLAYTETAYEYIGVVFTGMPIVTLEVEAGTEIGDSYVPARVGVSSAEHDAVNHGALVHLRGGGYDKGIDKFSYRIEFHEQSSGQDKKADISLLGMDEDTDWLLISNASDETGVCNHLCWDLWNRWNPDGDAPVLLDSHLVEVFVCGEYKGMYQLMQRIREEEEIVRLGGDPDTDYLYRIIRDMGIESRPVMLGGGRWYELRQKPDSVSEKRQFDRIEDYILLNDADLLPDDEEFAALAAVCVDIPALMNYFAFMQAADLGYENVDNNVYIWAIRQEDGRYLYHLSPWDMDNALPTGQMRDMDKTVLNLMMRMPFQILNLDVGGSRELYHEVWNEKRLQILTDDAIYQWFEMWENYVNLSGAYARESEKWRGGAKDLSLQTVCANMIENIHIMDREMWELWPIDGERPQY